MSNSSAKTIAATSGDSRIVDFVVVLAAGLFFANIVMGSEDRKEPVLAYAVTIDACPTTCLTVD